MRDKLIELLSENFAKFGGLVTIKGEAELLSLYLEAEKVADHLIAHGVTFAEDNNVPCKWIPVSERLPMDDGEYLVCPEYKDCCKIYYRPKVDIYSFEGAYRLSWFKYGSEDDYYETPDVTHWMPLPEPPKGESDETN